MWRIGAFRATDSRSNAEQPLLIRRRDASSSLVGSVEVCLRAPHPTAPRDQHRRAKLVSADLGLASEFPPVILSILAYEATACTSEPLAQELS